MGTMEKNYVTLLNKKSPKHMPNRFSFTPLLAGLMFALVVPSAFSADDDYLRALQMEAQEYSAPLQVALNASDLDALSAEAEASAKVKNGSNDNKVDAVRVEMETLLKHEKPTSYKYYKKLKSHDKKQIAEAYRADTAEDTETKLDNLRKKILDLYFKR